MTYLSCIDCLFASLASFDTHTLSLLVALYTVDGVVVLVTAPVSGSVVVVIFGVEDFLIVKSFVFMEA